jgi:alkanesulfonate monooxygenase
LANRLRFHWSMSSAGENLRGAKARAEQSGLPNIEAHKEFCNCAEECGIESLLTAFGFHRPDPIVMAAALGMVTEKVSFMVACRSGICSPVSFVQQVNSVSVLTGGRICLNVVSGHTPAEQRSYGDFLPHDERYRRTSEFLRVCRALWLGETDVNFEGEFYRVEHARLKTPFLYRENGPEIFVGGASPQAMALAIEHGSCLLTVPDTPEKLLTRVREVLEQGIEVGLLVSVIARPTREDALESAGMLVESVGGRPRKTHREFAANSDSVAFTSVLANAETSVSEWLSPYLWTGAVPLLGAPAIAIVGSYDEVAAAIWEYRQAGVTQFLFMGWPDLQEMRIFSKYVLPKIRQLEGAVTQSQSPVF